MSSPTANTLTLALIPLLAVGFLFTGVFFYHGLTARSAEAGFSGNAGAAAPCLSAPPASASLPACAGATSGPHISTTDASNDDRVAVQVWVFFAAAVAALIGSLGYVLRYLLGLTDLPPPEEEPRHH
jgi:hypothetical protein